MQPSSCQSSGTQCSARCSCGLQVALDAGGPLVRNAAGLLYAAVVVRQDADHGNASHLARSCRNRRTVPLGEMLEDDLVEGGGLDHFAGRLPGDCEHGGGSPR